MNRSPNNSLGYLDQQQFRSPVNKNEILQVVGNHFIHHCKQAGIASYVVADLLFHYSSYYKKILAKQNEMNDPDSDTTEYLHDPRLLIVTPNYGVIIVRALNVRVDKISDIKKEIKDIKVMLDKDCIFFWRLFQDIFKERSINFTGLLVVPNVEDNLICKDCSDLVLYPRHIETNKSLSDWIKHHLKHKSTMKSDIFVDVVTRLNALYVLFETPQQNLDSDIEEESKEKLNIIEEKVVKHVAKVLMTPQQYEILTSSYRHRYFLVKVLNSLMNIIVLICLIVTIYCLEYFLVNMALVKLKF